VQFMSVNDLFENCLGIRDCSPTIHAWTTIESLRAQRCKILSSIKRYQEDVEEQLYALKSKYSSLLAERDGQ